MSAQDRSNKEERLLAEARKRIEEVRKADLTIRVVSPTGEPAVDATVEVEQTGSDFLFGCNIYMFDRFDDPELD